MSYTPPTQHPGYQAGYQLDAYGRPVVPRTNTLAIVALVLAFTVPIAAIVTGHIALSQIKRTGEEGHGMAMAATIMGYVFTGAITLFVVGYFAFFGFIFLTAFSTAGIPT